MLLQDVPANESAGKGQKCLMDVGSLLIANTQPTRLIEPGVTKGNTGVGTDVAPSLESRAEAERAAKKRVRGTSC